MVRSNIAPAWNNILRIKIQDPRLVAQSDKKDRWQDLFPVTLAANGCG